MAPSGLLMRLAAIVIPVFMVIYIILGILNMNVAIESTVLLAILNTVFIFAISLIVAYISAKSYLASGLPNLLLLSSGVLTFGLVALIAGWVSTVPNTQNINVTIYNIGVLLASVFSFAGATLTLKGVVSDSGSRHRKQKLTFISVGVLVFVAIVTLASLGGITPLFFVEGIGGTALRQVVLTTSIVLFLASSLILIRVYFRSKSEILYWYSLGLTLVALGLFGVSFEATFNILIIWAGRSAQFVGFIYFLVSVLSATKS